MSIKRQGVATLAILLVILCLFLYVTSLSLACNASHDCCGEACLFCLAASAREEMMRLALLLCAVLLFAALALYKSVTGYSIAYAAGCRTPVFLKVKLSN